MIGEADSVENREANHFAMHLLMPTEFLLKDIEGGIDLTDDAAVKRLAERYRVPASLMALRLRDVTTELE
jgi:Zn-dependent peptidase ImmA (M78 family)